MFSFFSLPSPLGDFHFESAFLNQFSLLVLKVLFLALTFVLGKPWPFHEPVASVPGV